ncbi:hypothetical protein SPAN111604_13170 [Sphingomonas antarctica]|uniref:hypothetical protein n=1 Tax=Sphingomonas antarctica TaxID=2040274 RepID=UPI0039E99B98
MDLLSVIRRWRFRQKMPIREIERRSGLSRNTIRKYLRADTVEPQFKVPDRPSKLDAFAEKLSGWLRIEAGKSRKQKRTAKQMHADLVALGFDGSYSRVAAFVRTWKAERQSDQQTSGRGTFVPLVFGAGEAFQFDWSEDWAVLGGERVKLQAAHTNLPDIAALTTALEAADTALARTEGAQDSALAALRRAEEDEAPLAIAEAGAGSDHSNATGQITAIESRPEFPSLAEDLTRTREQRAEAAVKLEEATRDATAHDPSAIMRKIETVDARGRAAGEARTKLEMEIARFEGTIESEGGKGHADRDAGAREEAEAARTALQRVAEEAEMLKLLRETLDEARDETSAKFVGPVAKRAKRHIERLLPGCDLSFSEDLMLDAVVRGGISEGCGDLSRGTQEQLAVLTRIAFADMLLEQGRPVSLILDDPLVYADDARLDLMVEILSETAERMQVILLTCRDRAFRHVPGNRVSIG